MTSGIPSQKDLHSVNNRTIKVSGSWRRQKQKPESSFSFRGFTHKQYYYTRVLLIADVFGNPSYVKIFQFSVNEHFHYSRWKFKTTKNIGPDKFATLFRPSYVKIASVLTENSPEILLIILRFFQIRRIKIRLIWKSVLSRTRLKQKSSVVL